MPRLRVRPPHGRARLRLSKRIGIGPAVAFTAAQYLTETLDYRNGPRISGSITHQSIHEWLFLGARLTVFP